MFLECLGSLRSLQGSYLIGFDLQPTVVSVFIDKKATLFDQLLLQPLFVS